MSGARFRLTIDCDNAAFEGEPGAELARILRNLARRLDDGEPSGALLDSNGNKVGVFYVPRLRK